MAYEQRAYEKAGDLREGREMSRRSVQPFCSWYVCVCLRPTFIRALA